MKERKEKVGRKERKKKGEREPIKYVKERGEERRGEGKVCSIDK